YRPDYELAQTLPQAEREAFYRNVRATAESGWDFSSRWLRDPKDLRTLETTELLPVDLNCLLYYAEGTIAGLRRFRGQPGDRDVGDRFARAAGTRPTGGRRSSGSRSRGCGATGVRTWPMPRALVGLP